MADSKITALGSIGTGTDPANDQLVIVDVSDVLPTGMATTGTTKRVSLNNLLACSPTATLASATITGAATVGTTLGVTGVSTFAAGTALLPALTTTGDTNTGIYYPAADTFAVSTGGTERYRVDSSGNVGVGVTPSSKFHIDAGASSEYFRGAGNSGSNRALVISASTTTNAGDTHTINAGSVSGVVAFSTGGTERARIDANGNLILLSSATPATLGTNGQLTVNATSNTNLRFSYRGSDGTTRVANLTLA